MSNCLSILRLSAAACSLLAAAFGCDLLSDATAFSIDTDWQRATVDSAQLGISIPSGTAIPAIPCTGASVCTDASAQISCSSQTYDCSITCGSSGNCEIVATVEEALPVDISNKVQNETSAEALQKVMLQRVIFNTEENTLNFDTPKIEVFVGPSSAAKTTDTGVIKFATMPSIPKGTIVNEELKDITESGKNALANFVKNYKTPFKFLVRASLKFASGSPLPQGRLVIKFKAYFEIEPL